MRIKKDFLKKSTTPMDIKVLSVLSDWGRSDGNLTQLYHEIKYRKLYVKATKEMVQKSIDKLIDRNLVHEIEYKGGIKHYILESHFSY